MRLEHSDNQFMSKPGVDGHLGTADHAPTLGVPWTLTGFCGMCRVTTNFGDLPVQALRKRDPLRTGDGRLAQVVLINRISLDEGFLSGNPDARPVRISANAFGPGRPLNDLIVSPHQMVDCSPTSYSQTFRLARDLTDRPGVFRHMDDVVTYYMFHCGSETTVKVEGIMVPLGI